MGRKFAFFITLCVLIIQTTPKTGAAILNFTDRDAATVGIAVIDISSGKTLHSENENTAMLPASILKSATTASALLTKGRDFRYKTDVYISGYVDGNILNGDIIVKASGDPTINSRYFKENGGFCDSIVSAICSLGIREIKGYVIVDEGGFKDAGQNPQWTVGDVGWSYGAGYYAFNYCDNIFNLNTTTLSTSPEIPLLDIKLFKTTTSTDIIRGVDSDNISIYSSDIGKPGFTVTSTMSNPAEVFINELKKCLENKGITVDEDLAQAPAGQTLIYSRLSPELGEIMQSLMFRSDNMMAEGVLRLLDMEISRDKIIDQELKLWKERGVNISGVRLFDGSGLARADRVTPRFMAQMLLNMAKSDKATEYVSFFPKVGKEGTVKSLLAKSRLTGKLALKSGSVNGVQCFAGYKLDNSGKPTHVVVIMVNNFFCSRAALKKEIEQWLLKIF